MKKLVLLTLCLFLQSAFSTELLKIKVGKNQKIEGTFSAELSENSTLHFILTKNTDSKKYEIIPVFVDSNQKSKQLDIFETKEIPSFLSFHKNGSIVTLSCFYEKRKELLRIDFDVISGKFQTSITTDFDSPKNVFRLSNQTVFVYIDKMKHNVSTLSFTDSKEMKTEKFEFTKNEVAVFNSFFHETPEAVNQVEFVKNGPITKRKSYFSSDKLIFTNEKDNSNIQVLTLHLDGTKHLNFDNFNFNYDKNIKDQNTYVSENLLFSVAVSKEDVIVNAFDMNSKNSTKSLSLQDDLSQKFDAATRKEFINSSAKNSMKPTITINTTKSPNKFLIRLDRVNKNTYTYYHNWWHIHWMMQQQQQQMMLMQQQQMMRQSIPRGFGPNPNFYDALAMIYIDKIELKPIEFIVDSNLSLDEKDTVETVFKDIERDDYLDKFKDDKSMKDFSAGFTTTDFRYIYYDKKAEYVYLKAENL